MERHDRVAPTLLETLRAEEPLCCPNLRREGRPREFACNLYSTRDNELFRPSLEVPASAGLRDSFIVHPSIIVLAEGQAKEGF